MKLNLNKKYQLRLSRLIDRKLLHKVGKQWVIISLSALLLLAGASIFNPTENRVMARPRINRSARITRSANRMHRKLLNNARQRTRKSNYRYENKFSFVKGHFKRTGRKYLLKRSGYGQVYGYGRHVFRNYYAPNSHRAYVPRHFKLTNELTWLEGSNYRIHKYPNIISIFTYNKHGHKWLASHFIRKKTRRRHAHYHVSRRRSTVKCHRSRARRPVRRRHIAKSHQYLLRDKQDMTPVITSDGMHNLLNSDLTNYSDDVSDLSNSDNPVAKIKNKRQLAGFNLYKIKGSDEGSTFSDWAFPDELSHRHAARYHGNDVNNLKNALEQQFKRKYFTPDEQSRINSLKQNYDYLSKNENNSDTKDIDTFRQHEIDWINFYRTQLYNLQPVSENSDFDQKAQNGADTHQDPEDMVDTVKPGEAVNIFFTDENDGDGNDEAGHRDSVLNPSANQVGVGAHNDTDTLFFDWGINNGANNGQQDSVAFPNAGLFPLSDATNALDGSCWSYQFASHPYEMGSENDNNSYTPDISIHDDTSDTDLNVTDVNPQPDEVYYHVNSDALKDGHQYTVNISGLPNGNVNYSFKLFKLS